MPKYAQHFLINADAAERIVDALDLSPKDAVLEIGPGKGALTKRLLEGAGRVTVVEIDEAMVEAIRRKFKDSAQLVIMHTDVLDLDLDSIQLNPPRPWKIVGN